MPRIRSKNLIRYLSQLYIVSVIFCEAVAIYGIIIAIILLGKCTGVNTTKMYTDEFYPYVYFLLSITFVVPRSRICNLRSWSFSWNFQPCLWSLCRNYRSWCRPSWFINTINFREDLDYWDFRKCSRVVWSHYWNHIGWKGNIPQPLRRISTYEEDRGVNIFNCSNF